MRPEFVDYLRTAFGVTQPFSFDGTNFTTNRAGLQCGHSNARIRRFG